MTPPSHCLVLGGRTALERIDSAIDLALAALELDRVWPPAPDDVVEGLKHVDVILAEVSRPSPAISFELGIATAQGIPVATFATSSSRVSPVFRSVVLYEPDDPAPKLAYLFAKQLEKTMSGHMASHSTAVEQGKSFAEVTQTDPYLSDYQVGERFDGIVAHVETDGGFLLASTAGRRPAMLHVTNMGPRTARSFERHQVNPGANVPVEVLNVDRHRNQVQLRQIGDEFRAAEDDLNVSGAARLLRGWSKIESTVSEAEASRRAVQPSEREGMLKIWFNLYEPQIAVIRDVRNRVAHGEPVAEEELKTALEYLLECSRRWPTCL